MAMVTKSIAKPDPPRRIVSSGVLSFRLKPTKRRNESRSSSISSSMGLERPNHLYNSMHLIIMTTGQLDAPPLSLLLQYYNTYPSTALPTVPME